MDITNIKSNNNKAIILSFQNSWTGDLDKTLMYDCCNNNDIEIIKFLHFENHYDAGLFCELIEIVNNQEQPPILIMQAHSHFMRSQIMTLCVITTLEMTGAINFCAYLNRTVDNKSKLHFTERTDAFLLIAEIYLKQLLNESKEILPKDKINKNGGGK